MYGLKQVVFSKGELINLCDLLENMGSNLFGFAIRL